MNVGGVTNGIGRMLKGLKVNGGGLGGVVEAISKGTGGSGSLQAALANAFKAQPNGGGGLVGREIDPRQASELIQKIAYMHALNEELERLERSRMPVGFQMIMFERRLRSIRERGSMLQKQRQMSEMLQGILSKQSEAAQAVIRAMR